MAHFYQSCFSTQPTALLSEKDSRIGSWPTFSKFIFIRTLGQKMLMQSDMKARVLARRAFASLMVTGTLLFPQFSVAQELARVAAVTEAPANTSIIVRAVRSIIEKEHISHPQFNDEMSYRGFEIFLKNVDPLKSYLLLSDVDEFRVYQNQLDDMIKKSNVDFAYMVFKRYLKRLDQFMPYIHEQIDATHDFNVDESIISDAKELPWAAD